MSRLDYLYRSLLLTKFFTKGWGKPENLKRFERLITTFVFNFSSFCQTHCMFFTTLECFYFDLVYS